jgi:hypothetical protein
VTGQQWEILPFLLVISFLVTWIVCVILRMTLKEAFVFALIVAGIIGATYVGKDPELNSETPGRFSIPAGRPSSAG